MLGHSASWPLTVTGHGWGMPGCHLCVTLCVLKKKPRRLLHLGSKSPILNANLVGSDYPCLEFFSKQTVIQIRTHLLWWVRSTEGTDGHVGSEEKHGKRSVAFWLPTIRKQFFFFISRSKLVKRHMCWPSVLALQGMFSPTTWRRKVRMEKPGYKRRDQMHIWTQGRVEEKIKRDRNRQYSAKIFKPLF